MRFSSLIYATSIIVLAQQPGAAPGAGAGGGGATTPTNPGAGATNPTNPGAGGGFGNTNPTNPGNNRFPGQNQDPNSRFPDMMQNRPIFISGKVVLEDGTPPPDSVTIERVCNGVVRPEGYTDSKGRFSFELGRNNNVMADASTSSGADDGLFGGGGGFGGNQRTSMGGFGGQGRGISERDLMGCEIRASLSGFRGESVNLAGRRSLDNPDIGTIILRRMANVEGYTFSLTTAMAPREAKRSFDKSRDLLKKKKFDEAQAELEKATAAYAKYAIAWYDLGRIYEMKKQNDAAIKAYESAMTADPKYVNPYTNLSLLLGQKKEWQRAADVSAKGIKLNPIEFPQLFYYNAVANMNLGKLDDAEKSARDGVKADPKGRIPRMDHLLGNILAEKNDLKGAAESYQNYLKKDPNAPDAAQVKFQITEYMAGKGGSPAAAITTGRVVEEIPVRASAPAAPAAAPGPPAPATVSARTAWPSWSGGISDLPPGTLSKTLDAAALGKEIAGTVYWIRTAGDVGQLSKPATKYQGAAVAVSKNLLVTNCDVLEATGATGIYQNDKLLTSNVRLTKSKRAAGMCVLEVSGVSLQPVNGVRYAQDLSAGEKTFTATGQGVGEGKLATAKTQGGLKLLLATSPVTATTSGGGLFDEFGNLIGVTTLRSMNAVIAVEEFYQ